MTENLPKAVASYFNGENQSSQKALSAKRLDKYPFHLIFFLSSPFNYGILLRT